MAEAGSEARTTKTPAETKGAATAAEAAAATAASASDDERTAAELSEANRRADESRSWSTGTQSAATTATKA